MTDFELFNGSPTGMPPENLWGKMRRAPGLWRIAYSMNKDAKHESRAK